MRKCLNILQSTTMAFERVTEANVCSCTGTPSSRDIDAVLNWMLNDAFDAAYQRTHP